MSESQIRIHITVTTQNVLLIVPMRKQKVMPLVKNARTKQKLDMRKLISTEQAALPYLSKEYLSESKDGAVQVPARTACKDVQKCTNSCHSPHLMILT
jgi:hypothetical protein